MPIPARPYATRKKIVTESEVVSLTLITRASHPSQDGDRKRHGTSPHRPVRGGPSRCGHHLESGHEGGGPDRHGNREVRGDSGRVPGDGGHGHHRESAIQEL